MINAKSMPTEQNGLNTHITANLKKEKSSYTRLLCEFFWLTFSSFGCRIIKKYFQTLAHNGVRWKFTLYNIMCTRPTCAN